MAKPIDVGAEEFQVEVLEEDDTPVLVDFWSPTCGHCLTLNPHFEQAAEKLEGTVRFVKVSFPENREVFQKYGVRATPTMVLIRGGEEVDRTVGARRADEIGEWLEDRLES